MGEEENEKQKFKSQQEKLTKKMKQKRIEHRRNLCKMTANENIKKYRKKKKNITKIA